MQKALRLQDALADGDGGVEPWPKDLEEMTANVGCIICFAEVVDTLLMPCRHLVLCGVSSGCPVGWGKGWLMV